MSKKVKQNRYLNTSHVKVKHNKILDPINNIANLNTSHVKVKP